MPLVYEFGQFRYDPAQRLLFRGAAIVPLLPKVADTLHVLIERRGEVVDKAELMKLLWPDCTVEEIGLARNVSLLRKALGDEGDGVIETIPKRGYRFAADVRAAGAPEPAQEILPPPAQRWYKRRRLRFGVAGVLLLLAFLKWQFYSPSRYLPRGAGEYAELAVIPLESLSPELDRAEFSEGFNGILTAEVSKLGAVHVISPSTVRHYQRSQIPVAVMGRLLNLHAVLEGTVQKLGDKLRVTVRLSDVHSGKLIWSESYDRPAADLGAVQRELAVTIAAELRTRLALGRPAPSASR
jgi:DNA-binding winged helix-turn-helix (wHTH) protein/TolB-like protein